jgi:glucose/mannose-6-phosphate isomerase
MKQLIEDFGKEISHAIEIGQNTSFVNTDATFENILVSGMGGSGIGGSIAYSLLNDQLTIPFQVNKGYSLPNFIGKKSLVVVCSYSGNTEESISAFHLAKEKNATIVCITSGGELQKLAIENNLNHIISPSGRPPRASLGYSLVQLFFVLKNYHLINESIFNELKETVNFITSEQNAISSLALEISNKIYNKLPVIYCEETIESIAIRWKQQLNENSKMLCWHNVYPELNHNELVGWREEDKNLALIFLKTGDEYIRNKYRIDFNQSIFEKITDTNIHIIAKGTTKLDKVMYLIHFGDWLSYHLAIKRGYDPIEIEVLIDLKNKLANTK